MLEIMPTATLPAATFDLIVGGDRLLSEMNLAKSMGTDLVELAK